MPALGRPVRSIGTVMYLGVASRCGAVGAAIKRSIYFNSMPDDAAATVRASRRQGLDRAFEAVEDPGFAFHLDGERFVVIISAH